LNGGDRQAIAERERRVLDIAPVCVIVEATVSFAGQRDVGQRAEAETPQTFPQRLAFHRQRNLARSDVARFLDHAGDIERAEILDIANGVAPDLEMPRCCLDDGIWLVLPGFEPDRYRERLHRRAGFEQIGHRAIAEILDFQIAAIVRIVRRLIDQRDNLARRRIDDDHRSRARALGIDGILERAIGDVLHPLVEAEMNILARSDGLQTLDVLDDAPQAILEYAAQTRCSPQQFVIGKLDAFLSAVVDIRETDDMAGHFGRWIIAPILLLKLEAGETQVADRRAFVRRQMTPQIDELAIEPWQHERVDLLDRDAERRREVRPALTVLQKLRRFDPGRLRWRADGQRFAGAIENHTAIGMDLIDTQMAGVAMALQKFSLV